MWQTPVVTGIFGEPSSLLKEPKSIPKRQLSLHWQGLPGAALAGDEVAW